jgi:hypothetical protein
VIAVMIIVAVMIIAAVTAWSARPITVRLPGTLCEACVAVCVAVGAEDRINVSWAGTIVPAAAVGLSGAFGSALIEVDMSIRAEHRIEDRRAVTRG